MTERVESVVVAASSDEPRPLAAVPPRRRSTDHVARGPLAWLTPARVLYGMCYASIAAAVAALVAVEANTDDQLHEHASNMIVGAMAATVVWVPITLAIHRRAARQQYERERLLERLVTVSDLERRRVAAEVHDGALQDLIGLSFRLETVAGQVGPQHRDDLREAAQSTRGLMTRMRSLLQSMYPVDVPNSGWRDGFQDLTIALRRMGVHVHIDIPKGRLAPLNEVVALRVTREALRNVAAHASADNVWVTAEHGPETIRVAIVDDGIGFDRATELDRRLDGHFGMQLLHDLACEAGAALSVSSAAGQGTRVELELKERRHARPGR